MNACGGGVGLRAGGGMRSAAWLRWISSRGAVVGCAAVIAGFLPIAAHCEDDSARVAALLDRPALVKKVPPRSGDDPVGEITCTWYPDLMVRESGTDTPDPNAAMLVPLPAGGSRPPCD